MLRFQRWRGESRKGWEALAGKYRAEEAPAAVSLLRAKFLSEDGHDHDKAEKMLRKMIEDGRGGSSSREALAACAVYADLLLVLRWDESRAEKVIVSLLRSTNLTSPEPVAVALKVSLLCRLARVRERRRTWREGAALLNLAHRMLCARNVSLSVSELEGRGSDGRARGRGGKKG
eukprot:765409-Hanusia_phi.AAC.1